MIGNNLGDERTTGHDLYLVRVGPWGHFGFVAKLMPHGS